MEFLHSFFDIETILFTLWEYPISAVELVGTLFGLICVWLAARENIFTWPTGMLSILCFFAIFYQVHLYSDMLLQVYFFSMSIYGWISWRNQSQLHVQVQVLTVPQRIGWVIAVASFSIAGGILMTRIHLFLPEFFPQPAAFPFVDTFIAVASVVGMIFQARRILENWILWLLVDAVAIFVYFERGILLVAIEYFIFLGLASYGLHFWWKDYQKSVQTS